MMKRSAAAFVLLLLSVLASTSASPWKLSEPYSSTGSLRQFGLFIDPTTKFHHLMLFDSAHPGRIHYLRLSDQGVLLTRVEFSVPSLLSVTDGKLVGSEDGQRLHLLVSGIRRESGAAREHAEIWYAESEDGGGVWSFVEPVPREGDQECHRRGNAMMAVKETGRVYVFYSFCCNCSFGQYSIRTASKPATTSKLGAETILHHFPLPAHVGYQLAAAYTLPQVGPSPVLHLFWVEYRDKKGNLHYARSTDGGTTWEHRGSIVVDTAGVGMRGRMEIAGNLRVRPDAFYLLCLGKMGWQLLAVSGHGEYWTALSGLGKTLKGKEVDHEAGVAICGVDVPLAYTLLNNETAPTNLRVLSPTCEKPRSLRPPFETHGKNMGSAGLACSTDPNTGGTMITVVAEIAGTDGRRKVVVATRRMDEGAECDN